MKSEISVTELDYSRLNSLILRMLDDRNANIHELNFLNIEIKKAKKIDSLKYSPDFVTMNSVVEGNIPENNKSMSFRLVYPQDANNDEGFISVLSSLGCGLLGKKAGESVSFKTHEGTQTFQIDKIIYQPEKISEYSN